jgi:hypothetical protein
MAHDAEIDFIMVVNHTSQQFLLHTLAYLTWQRALSTAQGHAVCLAANRCRKSRPYPACRSHISRLHLGTSSTAAERSALDLVPASEGPNGHV